MQQQGGDAPTQSQHEVTSTENITIPPATAALNTHVMVSQQQQLVEEASPISSRPPNLDDFMRLSGSGVVDEDALGEADRSGGVATGNRWPRQETLALLQIRSEMDAAFRDASVKAPLWEDVSRKMAELGYKRSAKKCKEKFENVDKYYKRTKEGRGGRQDGKSYRFFTQLEALHNTNANTISSASQLTTTTPITLDVAPVSVGIPMSISSIRIPAASTTRMPSSSPVFPPNSAPTLTPAVSAPSLSAAGISFSSTSDSLTSSPTSQDDDQDDEAEPSHAGAAGTSRKRKRRSSKGGGTRRMMEFFEGLMKHVMQKQENMQQRFLEAIEKREHERMIREETWKRQEMTRLSREHELMAQERAISASRDAAIVSFLQKITGQTIQLPSPMTISAAPPQQQPTPQPVAQPVQLAPVVTVSIQQPPPIQPQPQPQPQKQDGYQPQQQQASHHQQSSISLEVAIGVQEQEIGSGGSLEPGSSRWPKAEVLALIKLRSGLESRYQEAGPKGPLWEEISSGMQQMGYKRSAKRCKEKWENINKYFKKVKESNKKRPEDAKTCPYFHELDALYRKKILGSSSGFGSTNSIGFDNQSRSQEQENMKSNLPPPSNPDDRIEVSASAFQSQSKSGGSDDANAALPGSRIGEGNDEAQKKPEDIMKEFMKLPGTQNQQQQQLVVHDYEEDDDSDNVYEEDGENEVEDEDDDDDDEIEEERKMAYKIEFQRQNTSASNGGGNFLAMVQ